MAEKLKGSYGGDPSLKGSSRVTHPKVRHRIFKKMMKQGQNQCDTNFVNPFIIPDLRWLKKGGIIDGQQHQFSSSEIWKMDNLSNPIVIFGQPYSGKTCLMMKLVTQAMEKFGKGHWIRLINLKDLAKLCKSSRRPKTFVEVCASYLHMTEAAFKGLIKPLPKSEELLRQGEFSKMIKGELFLDGLDEMPAVERDNFLRAFSQTVSKRSDCSIRIWVTCKSHLKAKLITLLGDESSFEIVNYSPAKQIELMYLRWRDEYQPKSSREEGKLMRFANLSHTLLQQEIKDFGSTLGAAPFIMEIITGLLAENMTAYMEASEDSIKQNAVRYTGVSLPEIVESLTLTLVESYILKMNRSLEGKVVKNEYVRITRAHCKFAISTYPLYVHELEESKEGHKLLDRPKLNVEDEIFQIGFLLNDNGVIRFHHKLFGDFFLGKHYANPDAIDTREPLFDRFYLRVLLVEPDAKDIRKYYDALLYTVQNYHPSFLREFLVKHYKLRKRDVKEWQKIKNNGNVWHLLVMEGFHRISQIITDSFRPSDKFELCQFLKMTAPLEIFQGRIFSGKYDCGKEHHDVTSLSMVALFGFGLGMRDFLELFQNTIGNEAIQEEFDRQGKWTPMHYAAIHSNLWFIGYILKLNGVRLNSGIYNPKGQLPQHCLMSHAWFHALVLRDSIYPEYDNLPPLSPYLKLNEQVGCGWKDFREIVGFRDMVKDLRGENNFLREVHHHCIVYMSWYEDIRAPVKHIENTMLHLAARDGHFETVKHLVHLGVKVDAQDKDGRTPLHYAAMHGHRKIFLYLTKKKGRPTLPDKQGVSAIVMWKKWGDKLDYAGPFSKEEVLFFKACEDISKLPAVKHFNYDLDKNDNVQGGDNENQDEADEYENEDEGEESEQEVTSGLEVGDNGTQQSYVSEGDEEHDEREISTGEKEEFKRNPEDSPADINAIADVDAKKPENIYQSHSGLQNYKQKDNVTVNDNDGVETTPV